jgi:choline dehydrogenase-like flavoprotein
VIFEGKAVPEGTVDCQAVVVGSGAAGAVIAKELSEAGVDVILLEAGAYHRPERDFNQREEVMMPSLFYEQGGRTTSDLGVTVVHGRGVGGSTVHNICLCVRPEKAILDRWAEEFGVEGMSLDALTPALDRVWKNLGVNPMLESQMNPNNRKVKDGADKLGWKGFIPNHNRIQCLETGFCELGCTYNRKQSMLITYVPKADANGTRIFADCRADKVLATQGRATGVEATVLDRATGKPLHKVTIRAKTVILSGGAIMSPALLLKSDLANSSGLVGKTLHLHPSSPVAGLFDEKIEGWRGIPQTYIVDEFAEFYKDGYGGYVIIPVFAHPGGTAVITPGMNADHASLMGAYDRLSAAVPMIHDETVGSVTVKSNGQIVLDYWPEEEDQRWFRHGIKRTAEMYFAAGAKEVMLPYSPKTIVRSPKELDVVDRLGVTKYGISIASVHPQGSVRMSADPEKGVVDSHCESHDVKNLFVCDTSVFPTSLGTPPMIPTAAIATHTAKYMLGERRRLFE